MSSENSIAKSVVDAAYQMHVELGPGLLESVYEQVLAYELRERGHCVETQVPIAISYKGVQFENAFRADLIVDDALLLELKSLEQVGAVHKKQLMTYLRLTGKRLGLLINFGAPRMKEGITRLVNGLPEL
jgi:GxxExxY protein